MLIDDIDFATLYQQQMKLAKRTEKTPEHWDRRAEKMAQTCANPQDPYLAQLIARMDFTGAQTLLDMGCGPGSVCLNVADRLQRVYGLDYSSGMLAVARQRAQAQGIANATLLRKAWEDSWDDVPQCDIAVASRSTLVADLRQAMRKLNDKARLRVYTTHTVSPSFVDPAIQRALGRPVVELPNYAYAFNVLYQMGIQPRVDFIRGPNCQAQTDTFEAFISAVAWSTGELNDEEKQRLFDYFTQRKHGPRPLVAPTRDWALLWWDRVDFEVAP
ncbi:methyltransferase family protein [Gibbsiella quercinecans]|uniref:Methyltransferase n=1 Tax=Gibbsiella quercinecans TaxID=929813 RepID=A0A250B5J6_9GAMM|nr:class I SAM-dependent methyltransferase [Gibbsiella quercinecans]ATA21444.1 methyltransferase [Gibbsiella quercinecans]RLM07901.1 methyltransferase [Gibbsiella quercinecans]RLM09671.1 methyltransferase [Gibbsiella quercinecans]TCT84329.1 methyltransferase family protein [Gibbsiella quercinecans]